MKPIVAIKFDGSLGVNKSKDVAFSDVTIPKLWAAVLPGWYFGKIKDPIMESLWNRAFKSNLYKSYEATNWED